MRFRRIISRADFMKLPKLPLPFHVRSTGHYVLGLDFRCGSSGNEGFVEIFWGIGGEGEIEVNGEFFPLKPCDVVWKLTGEPHGYKPQVADWELRWVTFDGALADAFMQGYGYPRRIAGAGPCPTDLFLEMETGLQKMSPNAQRRMTAVASEILALAGRGLGEKEDAGCVCDRFIELVQANYMNANINVNILADMLDVHRATLSRHFKDVMLMTPGEYLSTLRMQKAMGMLEGGELSVSTIAAKVGMPDLSHFSNAVKRVAGLSPLQLRRRSQGHG